MLGKSVYFFVVLRYGRSCQEMCGTRTNRDRESCSHHSTGGTYSETNPGTHRGSAPATSGRSTSSRMLKTTQHAANTKVKQVVNTVEVKTLKIINKTMQTTINLAKIKQVESLQFQYSAETDHQCLENHAASLEHAMSS